MGLSLTWLLLATLCGLELVLFQQVFVNQLADVINLQTLESGFPGKNTSPPDIGGWS